MKKLAPFPPPGNAPCARFAGKAARILLVALLVLCPSLFAAPASAASLGAAAASGHADGAKAKKTPASAAKAQKGAPKRGRDIAKAKASKVGNVTYTGSAVKPKPKLAYGKKRLVAGRDYKLSYKSNVKAGMARIVAKGKGSYSGKKTVGFRIVKARVSKLTVAKVKARTFTGNPVRVSPAIAYNGKRLEKGSDYTLSYKSNVNAGRATVTINGKGNFCGTRKVRFTIGPASLSEAKVASIPASCTTGLAAVRPSPTVRLGRLVLKKGSDYGLSYKNNVQPGTATVTVKAKSGNFTGTTVKRFKLVNLGDGLARAACEVSYSRKVKGGKGTKAFVEACKAAGCYSSPYYGRSCIFGMCTAIRTSGYDTGFPKYNWSSSLSGKSVRAYFHYLEKGEKSSDVSRRSPRWTCVGTYPADESKLLPGDVLAVLHANGKSTNHIWMYVGDEIAAGVYQSKLKGTDADKGAPTGAWVQAHGSSKSAPSIEGPNANYDKSPNPVRIYRCTNPENKR